MNACLLRHDTPLYGKKTAGDPGWDWSPYEPMGAERVSEWRAVIGQERIICMYRYACWGRDHREVQSISVNADLKLD